MSAAARVIHGDCLDVMARLLDDGVRVDAVVTDPPYHLTSIVDRLGADDAAPIQSGVTGVYARSSAGFMGQKWDGGDVAFRPETWRRVLALMKPGAHLIAFSATRTYHRTVCAIEDAGFEIRDMLPWLYGTGFPKSHNLDGDWDGWGTAVKPGIEPAVLARKPLIGSVPDNVALFGTGALNIDACRIPVGDEKFDGGGQSRNGVRVATHHEGWRRPWMDDQDAIVAHRDRLREGVERARALGRWPANVAHDGSDEVLDAFAAFGERGACAPASGPKHAGKSDSVAMGRFNGMGDRPAAFHGDRGTAARFFYSAKATNDERVYRCRECGLHQLGKPACGHDQLSSHPTVKPHDLMRWYVRMITPPGGLVLDPFAGTGTTGAAARAEGFQSLLIEQDDDYVTDICVRLGLDRAAAEAADVAGRPVNATDAGPLFGGLAG